MAGVATISVHTDGQSVIVSTKSAKGTTNIKLNSMDAATLAVRLVNVARIARLLEPV